MKRLVALGMVGAALAAAWWDGPAGWPEGPLDPVVVPPASDRAPTVVYLDAGHGAPDNRGNTSSYCVAEQDFTLALARDLAAWLERRGAFDAEVSRSPGERVPYRDRVDEAERLGADVFVSLHSDVRGPVGSWEPDPGRRCPRSRRAPGFAVLVSEDGHPRGHSLARALSARMRETGFSAYDGSDYGGNYEADEAQAGVFWDRHVPEERIFVLWRPSMPSILVETHHALDDREARRWREPETRDAFAAALGAALIDVLAPPGG